jgi:hypothetical protein
VVLELPHQSQAQVLPVQAVVAVEVTSQDHWLAQVVQAVVVTAETMRLALLELRTQEAVEVGVAMMPTTVATAALA